MSIGMKTPSYQKKQNGVIRRRELHMRKIYYDFKEDGTDKVVLRVCDAEYWDKHKELPVEDNIEVFKRLTMSHLIPLYTILHDLKMVETGTLTYEMDKAVKQEVLTVFKEEVVFEYVEGELH